MNALTGLLPWIALIGVFWMWKKYFKQKSPRKTSHVTQIRALQGVAPMRIVGDEDGFDVFNPLLAASRKNNVSIQSHDSTDLTTNPMYSHLFGNIHNNQNIDPAFSSFYNNIHHDFSSDIHNTN